ncbi:MAG TPA: restriction endonuclease subunit S [Pyrinomonadaceae bacterium]|nr:restriction endonuclease subunit S [Pyrinomonadaceae bacterium]
MRTYDKFKPSGVEWIGDIPEHWEVKKLKYWIDSIVGGGTPSTNNQAYWKGHIPWVSPKDMKVDYIVRTEDYITELAIEESATTLIPPGRVLIVVRSGILKHTLPVAINKVEVSLNQDMKAFEPKPKLTPKFLLWKLKGQSSNILTTCNKIGATVDSIEMENFLSFPFVLPPLSEQIAIADYLDEKTAQIDSLINNKVRLIELLKEERTAIINQAVTRGINPNAKLKPSGIAWLGDIPEHWKVVPLTKYLESIIDYRGKTPTKSDSGIFLVTARNIKNGEINYSLSQEYILEEEYEKTMQRGALEVGDVLFTTEAPLGEAANVDRTDVAVAQRVIKFRARKGILNNYFLKHWILSPLFQQDLMSYATGSTALGIKGSKLFHLKLLLPPIAEQQAILDFISEQSEKFENTIAKIEKEIGFMREYRTALISAVVTGKIKVV